MADAETYWTRIKEPVAFYAGGVYRYVDERDVFLWAQAIAFKVLITIVPIVILITGIVGYVLQRPDAFSAVSQFIQEFIPDFDRARQLIDFMEQLQAAGTFFTGLGIFALLFAAMTLFTTLRIVIGNVFQEEWHRHRSVWRGYLFDLRMAAQVGLLFLLTIGISALALQLDQQGLEALREVGLDYVWIVEGWRRSIRALLYLIPYLLSTAMFFQLFYFIPQPRPPKRSALVGALVTALLWEIAKLSFTLYATNLGRFERYRLVEAEEMLRTVGEAFGLVIAFVFWVYYSGVVLVIGGLIAMLNEKRVRMKRLQREGERIGKAPVEMDVVSRLSGDGEGLIVEKGRSEEADPPAQSDRPPGTTTPQHPSEKTT